jgi:hypothetical protein
MIGTNGKGVSTIARKNQEEIADIKANVAFIRGNIEGHIGTENPPPTRRTITIRRVLEVATVAGIFALAIGGVLLLVGGKLTADDIVRILSAWKGTP